MPDALGDRMKRYERLASGRFLPQLPICARIDGKRFSRFTRGLARPYDERLSRLMIDTTRYLVEETQAVIGYTQSDEISLVFYRDDPDAQVFLDGRIQKLTSILAAMTTAYFGKELARRLPEKAEAMPLFDCRTWVVPTLDEAVNVLVWREADATKNSLSMAAREHYGHGELHGVGGAELHELLHAKGINWNDYPRFFKRGTYVQRRTVKRRFTADELSRLPAQHAARQDPELEVERRVTVELDLPPIRRVANRRAVVFDGAEPITG